MSVITLVEHQILAVDDPTIQVVVVPPDTNPLVAEVNEPVALVLVEEPILVSDVYFTMQGPPGPPGSAGGVTDAHYVHQQLSPDTVWTITHNLNKYPSIVVIDSGGNHRIVVPDYVSVNQVILTVGNTPFGGVAYLN